jgi:hypothetical protein
MKCPRNPPRPARHSTRPAQLAIRFPPSATSFSAAALEHRTTRVLSVTGNSRAARVASADYWSNSGADCPANCRDDYRSNHLPDNRSSYRWNCCPGNQSSNPSNSSSDNRPDCGLSCPWNCWPCYRSDYLAGSWWNYLPGRPANDHSNHGSNCRAESRADCGSNCWRNDPRTHPA